MRWKTLVHHREELFEGEVCLYLSDLDGPEHVLAVGRGDEVAPLVFLVVVQRVALPRQPQQLRHAPLARGDVQVSFAILKKYFLTFVIFSQVPKMLYTFDSASS